MSYDHTEACPELRTRDNLACGCRAEQLEIFDEFEEWHMIQVPQLSEVFSGMYLFTHRVYKSSPTSCNESFSRLC